VPVVLLPLQPEQLEIILLLLLQQVVLLVELLLSHLVQVVVHLAQPQQAPAVLVELIQLTEAQVVQEY
jgi:hypothetical protein